MEIKEEIRKLVEIFKIVNDAVIGDVARQLLNVRWKEGLSARNQAHKILEELAATNQIRKNRGFYSVKEYQGEFREHDRSITEAIGRLLTLKLPMSVYREVSFSNGRRSDLVVLVAKDEKALCAVIECVNKEERGYLKDKIESWRVWDKAEEELSQLFGIRIPYFTIITKGSDEAVSFDAFLEEVKK